MSANPVSAVVLAAGRSRRMGQPKALLPWGGATVIETVVDVLAQAGLEEIVVVTNPLLGRIQELLSGRTARVVINPDYLAGEMLSSARVGLSALGADPTAALIALGDQPQIEPAVPAEIVRVFQARGAGLVVPSHNRRRGHPWLVSRALWPAVLALSQPATLRDFLQTHAQMIEYVPVETDSILTDLDTPEDYHALKPD